MPSTDQFVSKVREQIKILLGGEYNYDTLNVYCCGIPEPWDFSVLFLGQAGRHESKPRRSRLTKSKRLKTVIDRMEDCQRKQSQTELTGLLDTTLTDLRRSLARLVARAQALGACLAGLPDVAAVRCVKGKTRKHGFRLNKV
jgi:hypothetical protein